MTILKQVFAFKKEDVFFIKRVLYQQADKRSQKHGRIEIIRPMIDSVNSILTKNVSYGCHDSKKSIFNDQGHK